MGGNGVARALRCAATLGLGLACMGVLVALGTCRNAVGAALEQDIQAHQVATSPTTGHSVASALARVKPRVRRTSPT